MQLLFYFITETNKIWVVEPLKLPAPLSLFTQQSILQCMLIYTLQCGNLSQEPLLNSASLRSKTPHLNRLNWTKNMCTIPSIQGSRKRTDTKFTAIEVVSFTLQWFSSQQNLWEEGENHSVCCGKRVRVTLACCEGLLLRSNLHHKVHYPQHMISALTHRCTQNIVWVSSPFYQIFNIQYNNMVVLMEIYEIFLLLFYKRGLSGTSKSAR